MTDSTAAGGSALWNPDRGQSKISPPLSSPANYFETSFNAVSGVPYPLPIGTLGASTGVTVDGQGLVRVGDQILSGPGMLMILGPPAAPFVSDGNSP